MIRYLFFCCLFLPLCVHAEWAEYGRYAPNFGVADYFTQQNKEALSHRLGLQKLAQQRKVFINSSTIDWEKPEVMNREKIYLDPGKQELEQFRLHYLQENELNKSQKQLKTLLFPQTVSRQRNNSYRVRRGFRAQDILARQSNNPRPEEVSELLPYRLRNYKKIR